MKPSYCGVGYIGIGRFNTNGKVLRMWKNMLVRSYNKKYKKEKETYKDCYVCDEWHNFQNFAQWIDDVYGSINLDEYEYLQLDKDIIIKNNKVYSPQNCVLVNNDINILFNKRKSSRGLYLIGVSKKEKGTKFSVTVKVGEERKYFGGFSDEIEAFNIYKEYKENHIKYIADKYKNEHWMKPKLYDALYNYEVEITD